MQEMLCLKTVDGHYAYVNPAFADALAKSAGDILGHTDFELFGGEVAAQQAASDRRAIACPRGTRSATTASKACSARE